MPRIIVNDCAYTDPRFLVLGRKLRCSPGEAAWRCMALWSRATEQQSALFRPAHVAAALRCREERVAEVVDASEIGEVLESGEIELQLRDVFGGIEWLGEVRGSAPAVSQARAGRGQHKPDGTFATRDRDLEAEVLEAVGVQPRTRGELRQALACQKQALGWAVRSLLEAGSLVEGPGGLLSVPGSGSRVPGSMDTVEPVPREVHGTRGTATEPSTLTPVPAPDHALAGEGEARAHAEPQPRNPTAEPVPVEPTEPPEPKNPEARGVVVKTRYLALYEAWDCRGRELFGEHWKPPGPLAGQHRVREALHHPELLGKSDAEIQHGIEMLAAEAEAMREAGAIDASRWYRDAWSPRVLARACGVPNAEAARANAGARAAYLGAKKSGPTKNPIAAELDRRRAEGELL